VKALKAMDDDKVIEKGMHALHQALGPTGTRRFITLARPRGEDSVTRHRKWQEKLDKDVFFDKVFGSGTK
jgi:hypothetical protein